MTDAEAADYKPFVVHIAGNLYAAFDPGGKFLAVGLIIAARRRERSHGSVTVEFAR